MRFKNFKKRLIWLFEDASWYLRAKLTGRCYFCGLKGGPHKFSCSVDGG